MCESQGERETKSDVSMTPAGEWLVAWLKRLAGTQTKQGIIVCESGEEPAALSRELSQLLKHLPPPSWSDVPVQRTPTLKHKSGFLNHVPFL